MTRRSGHGTSLCAMTLCVMFLFLHMAILPAAAEESALPDLSRANAVYLYNLENDRVLVSKNTDLPLFPASTVKIMTGLVASEALAGRLQETVTVTRAMVDASSGFRMYLEVGEIVTAEQLLYAALCGGYNDACVVLAYLVAGSVDAFVAQMNLRAAELGMSSTVYTNPTGMHNDRMVTTVEDSVRLARAAMENETYMRVVSTVKYTMSANNMAPARTFYNRNAMIARNTTARYYNANVTGMNAGTTTEGGYCVVASAENGAGDLHYLCIVMGAGEDLPEQGGTIYSYEIANALLDYAMDGFGMVRILDTETVLSHAHVGLTERNETVGLLPEHEVSVYLPTNVSVSELQYRVMLNDENMKAPVRTGDVLGMVSVSYDGKLLATVNLCAAEDVDASPFLAGLDRISEYTTGRRFLLICGYAVLLLLGYFVGIPYLRKRRNRKRAKYF